MRILTFNIGTLGSSHVYSYFSLNLLQYLNQRDYKVLHFSFHEMGIYDLPKVTETILLETNTKKIFYVGHSIGTTQYFIALSELPELNNQIYAGFLLSPIAYIGHANNILRQVVPLLGPFPLV